MGELGFPIVLIGLEWSRIEPEPGHFDHAVIDRYREELADLKERGIKPLVTLHHFSNPLWLERSGQWTNPLSIKAFLRYVRYVVRALSELVDEWVTINEPNVCRWRPGSHRPVRSQQGLRRTPGSRRKPQRKPWLKWTDWSKPLRAYPQRA